MVNLDPLDAKLLELVRSRSAQFGWLSYGEIVEQAVADQFPSPGDILERLQHLQALCLVASSRGAWKAINILDRMVMEL